VNAECRELVLIKNKALCCLVQQRFTVLSIDGSTYTCHKYLISDNLKDFNPSICLIDLLFINFNPVSKERANVGGET
jgi:hypothetical protein